MRAKLKFARPLVAAVSLFALMGINAANAADVISEEPPAPAAPMEEPPLATWTGPYAGVTVGYGFAGKTDDKTSDNEIGTDGFVGGGFAGYNYQVGGIVAGIEGDVGYNGMKGSNAGTDVESGVDGSLRARLGYVVTPDVLVYTTAGGAAKRVSLTEGGVKDTNTALGWTAGAGTDVKITEQIFGRVEYRYSDYGSDTFNTGSGSRDADSNDHRIQFGVGMKF